VDMYLKARNNVRFTGSCYTILSYGLLAPSFLPGSCYWHLIRPCGIHGSSAVHQLLYSDCLQSRLQSHSDGPIRLYSSCIVSGKSDLLRSMHTSIELGRERHLSSIHPNGHVGTCVRTDSHGRGGGVRGVGPPQIQPTQILFL